MATEEFYSTIKGDLQNLSPISRRPLSTIGTTLSSPEFTRVTRSQTMLSPGGATRPSPELQYKKRSSTHLGYQASLKHLAGSHPDGFDISDRPVSSGNSQTPAHLQRSFTTKSRSNTIYGKSMWEEDEYVETGGGSPTHKSAGGAAARRINQLRKMQTVKLPENPFVDPDYADMTGHLSDKTGMDELRNAHQYKSLKIRSQNTLRHQFSEIETDSFSRTPDDIDMSPRERNLSLSSSISSEKSRIRRSDTLPALLVQDAGKPTDSLSDLHINGSVKGDIQPVCEEVDGKIESPKRMTGSTSSFTMYSERHTSIPKSTTSSSISSTMKPQLLAPSPAYSNTSKETANTYIPHSIPVSPSVIYKNNALDANVAIVIEETGPRSPMHGAFSTIRKNSLLSGNGSTSKEQSAKRDLKFDSPKQKSNCNFIIPIVIAVILILGLVAAVVWLALMLNEKAREINQLQELLSESNILLQTTTTPILALYTNENTNIVTISTGLQEATFQNESKVSNAATTDSKQLFESKTASITSSLVEEETSETITTGSKLNSESEIASITSRPVEKETGETVTTSRNHSFESKTASITLLTVEKETDKTLTTGSPQPLESKSTIAVLQTKSNTTYIPETDSQTTARQPSTIPGAEPTSPSGARQSSITTPSENHTSMIVTTNSTGVIQLQTTAFKNTTP